MAKLWMMWIRIRNSLWFVPLVLTGTFAALALGITELERNEAISGRLSRSVAFGGGTEGARGVLTAIAGGLITVTGVVFSVTIVALQLASTQFTPRLLRSFTSDRGNQYVLGVFIATFTYTLLVLRTIQSPGDDEQPFVPRVAVTIAVVMLLVSIGFLIYFIDHSARSMQLQTILHRVTTRTLADIERMFPEQIGVADDLSPEVLPMTKPPYTSIPAKHAGYLQAVDAAALFQVGREHRLVIRMMPYIGDFVVPEQELATVSSQEAISDKVMSRIRRAFVLGNERTPEQDVEVGLIEISDIAVKALSPGINDPTSALRCIDRLFQLLLVLGRRRPPSNERTKEGKIHYITKTATFERAVQVALLPIGHYGARDPVVAKALLETVARLADQVPAERGWNSQHIRNVIQQQPKVDGQVLP